MRKKFLFLHLPCKAVLKYLEEEFGNHQYSKKCYSKEDESADQLYWSYLLIIVLTNIPVYVHACPIRCLCCHYTSIVDNIIHHLMHPATSLLGADTALFFQCMCWSQKEFFSLLPSALSIVILHTIIYLYTFYIIFTRAVFSAWRFFNKGEISIPNPWDNFRWSPFEIPCRKSG